jgi:multicomponent K+:H+ antiporter subunit G
MIAVALEWLFVALLVGGAFFALVGSLGLLRLSDPMRRLHGPTKASTLGVGGVLLAAMLHHAAWGDGIGVRELLITLFLFIAAPVAAHLLAKAELARDPAQRPPLPPTPPEA